MQHRKNSDQTALNKQSDYGLHCLKTVYEAPRYDRMEASEVHYH